jgi:alkylation response protein AidB-like acyl-CoA dehydrogenase
MSLHPNCELCIFMGKTDFSASRHLQQSMILVPMNTPGLKIERPLTCYGNYDAPGGHAEVHFNDVKVPKENLLVGEGSGFAIAQVFILRKKVEIIKIGSTWTRKNSPLHEINWQLRAID